MNFDVRDQSDEHASAIDREFAALFADVKDELDRIKQPKYAQIKDKFGNLTRGILISEDDCARRDALCARVRGLLRYPVGALGVNSHISYSF